jgi:hypothetical protein
MRRLLNLLPILLVILLVGSVTAPPEADAQTGKVRRIVELLVNENIADAETTTTSLYNLEWRGMYPDSVVMTWWASASDDSIDALVDFAGRHVRATTPTYTLIDSIQAGEYSYKAVTYASYAAYDVVGLRFRGQSGENDTANRLWIRFEFFYHE